MTTSAMMDFHRQLEHITNALRTACQNSDDEVGKQSSTLALLLAQQLIGMIEDSFPGVFR